MGWRFRQSFKVIPGLRLNLSKSGLSASNGGAPFTFNIGPRGLTGTASIPGTGISYREHLGSHQTPEPSFPPGVPNSRTQNPTSTPPFFPSPTPASSVNSAPIEEIHSASTELLTSDSLEELKKLMQTTFEERDDISRQLETARADQQRAMKRYSSWERGFLFKRLLKKAFARRKAESETASAKVAELEEQLLNLAPCGRSVSVGMTCVSLGFGQDDRVLMACN